MFGEIVVFLHRNARIVVLAAPVVIVALVALTGHGHPGH